MCDLCSGTWSATVLIIVAFLVLFLVWINFFVAVLVRVNFLVVLVILVVILVVLVILFVVLVIYFILVIVLVIFLAVIVILVVLVVLVVLVIYVIFLVIYWDIFTRIYVAIVGRGILTLPTLVARLAVCPLRGGRYVIACSTASSDASGSTELGTLAVPMIVAARVQY